MGAAVTDADLDDLAEQLVVDLADYRVKADAATALVRAAFARVAAAERAALVAMLEARRIRVLQTPDDPSWTEHFAELQNEVRARGGS